MDAYKHKKRLHHTLDSLDEDDDDPVESKTQESLLLDFQDPPKSPPVNFRPSTSPNPATSATDLEASAATPLRRNSFPAATAMDLSDEDIQVTHVKKLDRQQQAQPAVFKVKDAGSVTGDIPRPLTAPEKKRKKWEIPQRPEGQQIFKGLIFYFFPNSDIGGPRNSRMRQAIEYGAKWIKDWNPIATHIIVDSHLDKAEIDKFIGLSNIRPGTFIVSEKFPVQCVEHRILLDASHYKHLIKGFEDERPKKRSPPPEDPLTSSDRSLQVKISKSQHTSRPLNTPQRSGSVDDSGDSLESITGAVPSDRLARATKFLEVSELQSAIAEARNTIHLPLESDEEEGPSRPGSSDSGSPEPPRKITKAKEIPDWQNHFQCMKPPAERRDSSASPNAQVIALLQEMADYYASIRDTWRPRAYRAAISNLAKRPTEITSAEEARQIPGVGDRLAAKIEEIKWTSRLRRLENAKLDEHDGALKTLTGIYGVGPALATRWIAQGLRTLDDLDNSTIELTPAQRIGRAHYDDFATRIPRAEVAQHAAIVTRDLHAVDPSFDIVVGGSYRRGASTCGDIDLIISHPTASLTYTRDIVLDTLIPRLQRRAFLVAALAVSDRAAGTKWHGASQLPAQTDDSVRAPCPRPWRRIDFLLVPADEMGAALLYFTGNDVFNRSMRLLARRKGMRLNQRGLYADVLRGQGAVRLTDGTRVAGREERGIFEALGVPWRECTERDA